MSHISESVFDYYEKDILKIFILLSGSKENTNTNYSDGLLLANSIQLFKIILDIEKYLIGNSFMDKYKTTLNIDTLIDINKSIDNNKLDGFLSDIKNDRAQYQYIQMVLKRNLIRLSMLNIEDVFFDFKNIDHEEKIIIYKDKCLIHSNLDSDFYMKLLNIKTKKLKIKNIFNNILGHDIDEKYLLCFYLLMDRNKSKIFDDFKNDLIQDINKFDLKNKLDENLSNKNSSNLNKI